MSDIPKRTPVDFLPMWRAYVDRETGVESKLITDLALLRGKVSLNHAYKGNTEEIQQGLTMFNEITISNPIIPESIQNLKISGDRSAYNDVANIVNAIANVIERSWDPKQFHLILHKCGNDSRIFSETIANLRDKHGEEWLGDVLFLSFEPESVAFKKTMEFEGWRKNQYHICNEGSKTSEYYAEVLDFEKCWISANDAQPPIWISMLTIEQLRESEIISKPFTETQLFHWGAGNRVFRLSPYDVMMVYFYSRWGAGGYVFPFSEQIMPFVSYDVLSLIKPDANLEIRDKILSYLSPELFMMPKGEEDSQFSPQRQLSERLRKKCHDDFTNSWYYNKVILPCFPEYDFNVPKTLWRDDWWGVYSKASLCEHLVKNGVTIINSTEK